MAKVGFTVATDDFNSPAVSIGHSLYSTLNMVVKRWPAATRFEFCMRWKERVRASLANISSFFIEIIVLTAKWRLGTFLDNNPLFFGGEFAVLHFMLRA